MSALTLFLLEEFLSKSHMCSFISGRSSFHGGWMDGWRVCWWDITVTNDEVSNGSQTMRTDARDRTQWQNEEVGQQDKQDKTRQNGQVIVIVMNGHKGRPQHSYFVLRFYLIKAKID